MNRRFLATAVAAALAVLGIVLILGYIHHVEDQPIPHGAQALTATQPIPEGTPVRTAIVKHMVKRVLYPRDTLPADYILWPTQSEISGGDVFVSAVSTDQIVLAGMIGAGEAESPLQPPPGMDEVGIVVCQPAAIGGFVAPGSRVTVVDTFAVEAAHALTPSCGPHAPPPGGTKTTVVLSDLSVLSVGNQLPAPAPPIGAGPTTTPAAEAPGCEAATQGQVCVVLAVSPADALKMANYTVTGDLSLVITEGGPIRPSATYP